jgi:hypothetical protein
VIPQPPNGQQWPFRGEGIRRRAVIEEHLAELETEHGLDVPLV